MHHPSVTPTSTFDPAPGVRDAGGPARTWPTVVAVAMVVVGVAVATVAAVLDAAVPAAHRETIVTDPGWTAGIPGLALVVPGALLLRQLPTHPMSWLLCLTGLHWIVDGAAASWLAYATTHQPALPGAPLAHWFYERVGALLLLSLPLVLLLYPDGRLPEGRWRIASLASLAATALLPVTLVFAPTDAAQAQAGGPLPEPYQALDLDLTTLPLPAAVWVPLLTVASAAVPVSLIVPLAVVIRRYRSSTGQARLRMRWLAWAALVDALVMLSTLVLPRGWTSVGLAVAVALTGIALVIGVARPQLIDIDQLLGGTVRYAALAAAVVVVDVLVLGTVGLVLGRHLAERNATVIVLLTVTAVYGPLRDRLWRLIRRVALGRRDDPYGVVTGLAEQLEFSDGPDEQLLAVARTVAEAFRSPYVAVEVDRIGGARLVAEHGTAPARTQTLPITYRGEMVGRLVLPVGGFRVALSARDERLLGDVVRQAAVTARASHLASQLQRGREQIVAAREEERRRLRRDLHDGLGPSLGAVALRIDAARNLAASAPDESDRLLRQAREDVGAAVADVRRLVHDLRPPALDDVGLLGAVRQQAERLRPAGLTLDIEGGPGLDQLPAAVEVAAYRIASEALTNVARHACATACRVRLSVDDGALVVEVTDNGVGIAAGTPTGVGLLSLRERAAELGGDCRIECPDERGTVVRARLPLGPVVPEVARA
ncbi:sensor histidine kinase [Luedemannella helvata]|uniref:histidine kinase n=1 Tax=Luedemannella helvata TaxID=349315 RepID=A0ABP4W377_9ACTN